MANIGCVALPDDSVETVSAEPVAACATVSSSTATEPTASASKPSTNDAFIEPTATKPAAKPKVKHDKPG